jgi:N-acetylglucosamine-6-phosphate deacetylase
MKDGTTWVLPEAVFDGRELKNGFAVRIRDNLIEKIVPVQDVTEKSGIHELSGILAPGFVDLQVNGGNGVLLNQMPTPDGIARVAAAHRKFGTVNLLPTIVTDAPDVMEKTVDAMLETYPEHGVLGIHLEGPHLSPARKGTHAVKFMRPLDETTLAQVKRLRQKDIPVLITVAPEAATPADITRLSDMGAVVSIGHSDADAEKVTSALAAGARCFTHLFNAMSPMQGRAPGVVGAAINSDAHVGIICDGIHVADEMVGLAIRARPVADRTFLVSDAMPSVGGGDGFDLYGTWVALKDGRLVNEDGNLAGAHTTMFASVGRLINKVGVEVETALRMATSIPYGLICEQGGVVPMLVGARVSDVLILDKSFETFDFLDSKLREIQ